METFFHGKTRPGIIAIGIGFAIGMVVLLSVWGLVDNGRSQTPPPQNDQIRPDLGITYLPLSPTLSERYGLEKTSGALVTGVASGGPCDKAGIAEGDIILSFNGTRLGEGTPLLGMIRRCCMDKRVVMEVWGQEGLRTTEVTLR